jgi:hypothetical protein
VKLPFGADRLQGLRDFTDSVRTRPCVTMITDLLTIKVLRAIYWSRSSENIYNSNIHTHIFWNTENLSCVCGSVTNNRGFWIGWLDLLTLFYSLSYSQSVTTAHNQWLPKTRSIPHWTASVFSSTVTDSVLIYESVTSSASGVRWLTLHSWTLNSRANDESRLTCECLINDSRIRIGARVRDPLRLAVYRQSVRLGDKPLETHDQNL